MPKLSEIIAKLESRAEKKPGKALSRYKGKIIKHIPLIAAAWYLYGMFINSIQLGITSTFGAPDEEIRSIWVANPIRNFIAIFTPTGLVVTGICVLLFCLITKKGYIFFSGYKYKRDPRGFDILPDGTHGSSGFMSPKEMKLVINTGSIETAADTIIGKMKESPDGDDKYTKYLTVRKDAGLTDHTIVFGATGSGKSRGYVLPFIYQAARRRESIIVVDPKAEIYNKTSEYLRSAGYTIKVFNLPITSQTQHKLLRNVKVNSFSQNIFLQTAICGFVVLCYTKISPPLLFSEA